MSFFDDSNRPTSVNPRNNFSPFNGYANLTINSPNDLTRMYDNQSKSSFYKVKTII